MSQDTIPANGDFYDSEGNVVNLATLLNSADPISEQIYNKKYYAPRNGEILGSNGKAYNLVDLVQGAMEQSGAIKFTLGTWKTALAKKEVSVKYDSSLGYAVSEKDAYKYRFGYGSYSRYYFKIVFDDVEYYTFMDGRAFFYDASGRTGAQVSYFIGNLEILGLSNITRKTFPFLLQAQVPHEDQINAENVNLLYTNDTADATHTLEIYYCNPTIVVPPMEYYRFQNTAKYQYSLSSLLFRGSGSDSIMMNLAKLSSGNGSLAEGYGTEATNSGAHAEGFGSTASGFGSHAEGLNGKATNTGCHAEGQQTKSTGFASHAEGTKTTASGSYSHSEGHSTEASSSYSHAEGFMSKAASIASHAEGSNTEVTGSYSHVEGYYSKAASSYQHVEGKYNVVDNANQYAHIVGGGNSDSDRKNIHTLDWNGNAMFKGDVVANDISLKNLAGFIGGNGKKLYVEEASLLPGVFYKFPTALDSLSIEFEEGTTDKNYKFRFGTSTAFSNLTLPKECIYPDGFEIVAGKTYEIEISDGFVSYKSWNYQYEKAETVTVHVGPGYYDFVAIKGQTLDEAIRAEATSVTEDGNSTVYYMNDGYNIYAYNGKISTWGNCYLWLSQDITQVLNSDITFEED